MAILTEQNRAFFQENGYVVVPGVVPVALCEAVVSAIFDFLEMDPNRPEDWYRDPLKPGGMTEMYHHQAMWDTRQHPQMYELFKEILGTPDLWVSIDRVNLKPPYNPDFPKYNHPGFMHWDVDTRRLPIPFGVQGVLVLRDTDETMGGFQCVPGLFGENLIEWIKTQPADRDPRVPDMTHLKAFPVPAKAGSMVVWDRTLAHGHHLNRSNKPRLSQYITMYPVPQNAEEWLFHRVHGWEHREPPGNDVFPGDPRRVEQKRFKTAELTPLGRRLLGKDPWK